MAVEIEHKFLVDPRLLPALGKGHHLRQGYLAYAPTVRLRIIAEERAELTIKGPGRLSRAEFNYDIPVADAESMWPLTKHGVEKRRYHVMYGGKTWEVDEFLGPLEGLWVAEIEVERLDEEFERPPWVVEEVTYDPRYTNAALAQNGLPS